VNEQTIFSLSTTYADVDEGQALAYIGSTRDHLEIAIRNGNAAKQFGVRVGDLVGVETVP
jgi:S-adenosylmethionine hydrolase